MRFELDDNTRGLTDEELLADLRRVAELLDKDSVTAEDYSARGRCSPKTLRRRFGSWFCALEKAGLKRTRNLGMTREELLADLRRVAADLRKDSVTIEEYRAHGRWSPNPFQLRFGSWFSALDEAGLARTRNLGITDEDLFENLEEVWIRLARQPKYGELHPPLSRFSAGTYENRFGTWRKALELFVQYANSESDLSTQRNPEDMHGVSSAGVDKSPISATQNTGQTAVSTNNGHQTKRTVSHRLRFLVFRRDDFRCVICGRYPNNQLGIELVVDHVSPWSKGGETVMDNLQTLCVQCNSGKSNLSM